jgi:hypothetical protein
VGIVYTPARDEEPAAQIAMMEHRDTITSLTVRNSLVASGDCTGHVIIWTSKGVVQRHMTVSTGPIRSLQISADAKSLLCGKRCADWTPFHERKLTLSTPRVQYMVTTPVA